jgi:metal-responsive CopG/Arc/MetJ family transcriptional regulator
MTREEMLKQIDAACVGCDDFERSQIYQMAARAADQERNWQIRRDAERVGGEE